MKSYDERTLKTAFIDAHSHFSVNDNDINIGKDRLWSKNSTIEEYCLIAKKCNVNQSMIIPCPSPQIIMNNACIIPFAWEERNGKIEYYQKTVTREKIAIENVEKNPYRRVNLLLWNYIDNFALESDIRFNFVPLLNLVFDNSDYIIEMIKRKPKAFKIHGISGGIDDFCKINLDILKIISRFDIPIIVHTDFFLNPVSKIEKVYNANNPLNWIALFEKFSIRAMLTHGVRLSQKAIDIVNNSEQFMVGIAPDLLLESETTRLETKTKSYLNSVIETISIDKLMFDIDFPWNVVNRNSLQEDDRFVTRLNEIEQNAKLSYSEIQKVANGNAKDFFRI